MSAMVGDGGALQEWVPERGAGVCVAAGRRWLPSLTDAFCFSFKCLQALNV